MRFISVLCLFLCCTAGVASAQPVTVEYYHLDAIGSVRVVTDKHGGIVRRHDYRPFGEGDGTTGTTDSLRFSSKERDAETGADYFGARYYASRTGRFTTVDPGHVGGNIFDPQSWNAYAYARNNPLRFVDPTGTDYFVQIEGGSDFWFMGGPINEFGQLKAWAGGFDFRGGMWGGDIYNAAGVWVGSYTYADRIVHLASDISSRTAGVVEAIGVAATAAEFALAVTNPIASTAANCAVRGCTAGSVGLAMPFPARVLRKLGTLVPLAEAGMTVADAIRVRGGTGQTVNRVATRLRNLPLGRVAQMAADGDAEAETAMKLVKQAAKKAER